jgi:hypothetical protein
MSWLGRVLSTTNLAGLESASERVDVLAKAFADLKDDTTHLCKERHNSKWQIDRVRRPILYHLDSVLDGQDIRSRYSDGRPSARIGTH